MPFILPGLNGGSQPLRRGSDGINQGLVGAWMLNEGKGGFASDWSGRNASGTIPNNKANAWKYNTMSLNGVSGGESVIIGTQSWLNLTSPVSASAWVNPQGTSGPYQIISKGYDGSNTQWQLELDATNHLSFNTFQGGAGRGATSAAVLSVGRLYHVAGIYDGTTWRTYINGLPDGTSVDTAPTTGNERVVIGGVDATGSIVQNMNGYIQNVRLWNRALRPSDVLRLYAEPMAGILLPSRRSLNSVLSTFTWQNLQLGQRDPVWGKTEVIGY